MEKNTIYTIGYERRSLSEFVKILKEYGINLVVDVRENPQSRRREFSITPLSKTLFDNNINYISMKKLGTPKELRQKYTTKKITFKEFEKKYLEYLNSQSMELEKLVEYSLKNNCVLMCYERDWRKCHRRIIADMLKKKGFNVVHL